MGVAGACRPESFRVRVFLLVLALGGAQWNVVLAEPQPEGSKAKDAADTEQPIFEKQVADAQKLVVSRRRVPRVADRAKEAKVEEWAKKQRADAKVTWPDRKYRYTFTSLTTDNEGRVTKRELWWFEVEQFASGDGRIAFLDAAVEEGKLVYVCQELFGPSRLAYANVVGLKAPENSRTSGLRLDTKRPGYSRSESEVKSARIEGSLKEGNLAILATVSSSQTLRFLFKTEDGQDKWERQPEPEPKQATPEQPDAAPAK